MIRRTERYKSYSMLEESFGVAMADAYHDIRTDYLASRSDRYLPSPRNVNSGGSGHDYHIRNEVEFFLMMERARQFDRDNMVVGQAVNRLIANVVQQGFSLDVNTGDAGVDRDLKARWRQFSESPDQCDYERELTFSDMEHLVLRHQIVDGDHVTLPVNTGHIQLVEGHRLRSPKGRNPSIVHGVEMDGGRRRLAYWLSPEDVDPYQIRHSSVTVRRIPSRDRSGNRQVFHHCGFRRQRVSQTRGVTAFAPIVVPVKYHDDLQFAQLVKAKVASFYAIFREFADSPPVLGEGRGTATTETRSDGTTRTVQGGSPGQEVIGAKGEKLHGFSPNIPNPEFFPHATLVLTFIAINLDLPVSVLLLDPKLAGNFSSWRGAMDQARQRFRQIQAQHSRGFHTPHYLTKLRQWIATDPILARAGVRLGTNLLEHRWNPPTWPYIEPVKDAMADDLAQSRNLISGRRRAQNRGFDFDDLTTEIIDDRAMLVVKAKERADEMNQQYADLKLDWRELAYGHQSAGISLKFGEIDATEQEQTANEP